MDEHINYLTECVKNAIRIEFMMKEIKHIMNKENADMVAAILSDLVGDLHDHESHLERIKLRNKHGKIKREYELLYDMYRLAYKDILEAQLTITENMGADLK